MSRLYAKIGSVSWGTLRNEDLIPKFLEVIEECNPEKAKGIREDPDWKPWFEDNDQQTGSMLFSELFDEMQNYAPPWCFFGTSDGDETQFGYWVDPDIQKNFDGLIINYVDREIPIDYEGEILYIDIHKEPKQLWLRTIERDADGNICEENAQLLWEA